MSSDLFTGVVTLQLGTVISLSALESLILRGRNYEVFRIALMAPDKVDSLLSKGSTRLQSATE